MAPSEGSRASGAVSPGARSRATEAGEGAPEALPEVHQMLEAIILASPVAIVCMDGELRTTLWNPMASKLFGWAREEVLGRPYPIVPDGLRAELMENVRLLGEGRSRSIETVRQHRDGSLIDVSLSTAPMLDRAGRIIGYMAMMADIRERKRSQEALRESEANYRTIFDAANDATFVFHPETGDIQDVNLKMCDMYGYAREEVLRMKVEDLSGGAPPYSRQDLLPKIWKTRHDHSHHFEWLARHRSGKLFWVEVNMKGAVIGGAYKVLAVVRDITERKAAEEENRKMQERLRQVDRMAAIGTLASGIAHEINNPNSYILFNAQLLSDVWGDLSGILRRHAQEHGEFFLGKLRYGEAEAVIPRILQGLLDGAHRINGIVTGLKDFARHKKARLDQTVDVNRVIDAALSMLQSQIRKHTDRFDLVRDPDLPPVKGSFQQLEQVVVNLTLNALQSLPDRNAGVSVSARSSGGEVVIEIRDEGVGMDEEVRQRIFDPFFTTKLDSGGTGLGLSICFGIVKEHNGAIECASAPGRGTTFVVRLPAASAPLDLN